MPIGATDAWSLLSISLLVLYWSVREYLKSRPSGAWWNPLFARMPLTALDAIITPLGVVTTLASFLLRTLPLVPHYSHHWLNIYLLGGAIAYTQIARIYSISVSGMPHHTSHLYGLHTAVLYAIIYGFGYNAAFSNDAYIRCAAYILCFFNVVRILAYRIAFDFPAIKSVRAATLYKSFLVLVVDVAGGSLVSLALSFGLVSVLLCGGGAASGSLDPAHIQQFSISHSSGDLFVDMFYYSAVSLTTVGYGDIVAVTVPAKLATLFFIFAGYIVIGTVLGMAASLVIGSKHDEEEQKTDLGPP